MIFEFLEAHAKYKMIAIFAISFVATWLVFKPLLSIAKKNYLQDNPEARKLQKQPVPVLGGAAVFFGIMMGLSFFKTMHTYTALFPIVSAMVIMLYVGLIDDIQGVKAWKRLLLEFLVALLLIYGNRYCICNFQGLFGINFMHLVFAVPLSAVSFVGIVNAINMIDGIDGLSSAFCMWICLAFGLVFFLAGDYSFAALAAASIGALLPFFLHNVFGWNSKMFIGDAGTMVMGTMISAMIFELLRVKFGRVLTGVLGIEFSLVSFCLAVIAIPIFDTLRVMFERIAKGVSPFNPDKRHLHHLFLELNFSYISITIKEILINAFVLVVFFASVALEASISLQFIIVFAVAFLADFGVAYYLRRFARCEGKKAERIQKAAVRSHVERKGFWLKLQKFVDGE